MKFSTAFAAVAASAVLVSSSPVPIVIASKGVPDSRLAHVVQSSNGEAPVAHRPCFADIVRQMMSLNYANKFRQALGLAPIGGDPGAAHGRVVWIHIEKQEGWWGKAKAAEVVNLGGGPAVPQAHPQHDEEHKEHKEPHHRHPDHDKNPHHPSKPPCDKGRKHHTHRHRHSRHGHPSFFFRLHNAIMALGPWEGRAVAFVIGAGIGVLLRMFWVLGVVAYRSSCGKSKKGYAPVDSNDNDNDEDDEDVVSPRRGAPYSAPPIYVYPVDEKVEVFEVVPIAEAPKSAPATGN